jgi:kumamolisin
MVNRKSLSGKHVRLSGSKKMLPSGTKVIGAVNPKELIDITVILRRRDDEKLPKKKLTSSSGSTVAKKYLTRQDFKKAYGASEEDVAVVEEFAHENDIDIVEVNAERRSIILRGTADKLRRAFRIDLKEYKHGKEKFRGRKGNISIPKALTGIIKSVHGLDNRTQAKPHFRLLQKVTGKVTHIGSKSHVSSHAIDNSFFPNELAKVYNFPSNLHGSGQSIAIIELGGGHRFNDLNAYFKKIGIPKPEIRSVSVSGAHNEPTGDPGGPDGEVMLDIEVAGSIAYQSKIIVYYAPNTDAGFLNAISRAVHDDHFKPSVISISWGAPEMAWTEQSMNAYNDVFEEASLLGVTICCASGDDGSSDERAVQENNFEIDDDLAHVDFPASSPFVIACGGTKISTSGGSLLEEVVWNQSNQGGGSTGGGVSDFFTRPDYQIKIKIPQSVNGTHKDNRGLPDLAGDADPSTGYKIQINGTLGTIGGTSAVAPLFSALVAIVNATLAKPLGFINPLIYQKLGPNGIFRDILIGSNEISSVKVKGKGIRKIKGYKATKGWDACTGWGSLDGGKLLKATQAA